MKSLQRYLPVVLLALLLIAGWQQRWWRSNSHQASPASRGTVTVPASDPANGPLNRHARLTYTKHAICRMECRHVTETEVQEILAEGAINPAKSNPEDHPCPTYALEGYSHEGQHLRIVFAPCDDNSAKVITCIDLDKDWSCYCD
ncbi:MAG TPA: DUF4258 domain-containing protein [Chitinophaga sp.]|uniref:DUF4258 domain-containing protein n=1 Tax=Chitinophaga sp. TaxID=1869181 RepID=UPI002BEBE36B|nr:DUF4258 domain-containing protein [Chitinophaga sp.]HVI45679.1 DUF4258 domain-containing protein [Chitinophaga sp.]